MKQIAKISLMITSLIAASSVYAADFYVSPYGNDANSGTLKNPWQTIKKANRSLKAGDTAIIRAGTYYENIIPANSGSRGSPITYKSYSGEKVYIRGETVNDIIVDLGSSHEYIVLDGLRIRRENTGSDHKLVNIRFYGGGHHTIKNCEIINTGDYVREGNYGKREKGIVITGGSVWNTVENCKIHGMSEFAIVLDQVSKYNRIYNNDLTNNYFDSIRINSSKYEIQATLIENNILGNSYVSDGVQSNPDYSLSSSQQKNDRSARGVIIRNNIIKGNAENGIDSKGAGQWVIENNIIYGASGDNDGPKDGNDRLARGGAFSGGASVASEHFIVRNNIIYDSITGIYPRYGYRIYNNTIINNNRDYTGSNSSWNPSAPIFRGITISNDSDIVIVNNIIGDNRYQIGIGNYLDANIDYNLYYNTWKENEFYYMDNNGYMITLSLSEWKNHLHTLSNVTGKELNSIFVSNSNVLFVNVPNRPTGNHTKYNFSLSAGSPAIDAGAALTKTIGNGSNSNKVKLADARFFYDGFGITDGDQIQIGDNAPVMITNVDYSKNIVTLKSSISWKDGDAVNLPYSGSAPDIGAYEANSSSNTPNTPTDLNISIN